MLGPKWDVQSQPCPKCSRLELVFDGSVKWRSGPRPPRELAATSQIATSPRADFEMAHYFHCAHCSTCFYDPLDGHKPHLILEKNQAAAEKPAASGWPPGSVGDVSARLGYDVRDLKMAGFGDDEIDQVLYGQRTLEDLLRSKPGK